MIFINDESLAQQENEFTVKQEKDFIFKKQKLVKTQSQTNKQEMTNFDKNMFEGSILQYDNKKKMFTLKCNEITYTFDVFYNLGCDTLYRFVNQADKKVYFITKKSKLIGPFEDVLKIVDAKKDNRPNYYYLVYDQDLNLTYVDRFAYTTKTDLKYVDKNNCLLNKNNKYVYCNEKYEPNPKLVFDNPINKLFEEQEKDFMILCDSKYSKLYLVRNDKIVKSMALFFKEMNIEKLTNEIVEVKADNTIYLFNMNNGELISDVTNDEYNFKVTAGTKEIYTKIVNGINNVVLVEKNGRYALADLRSKKLLSKFEFDNNKDVFENSSKYMKVVKNGKTGLYNTLTKKMVITPFCKNIILNYIPTNVEKEDYERFYFVHDNGKYGVVNSKNHVVIEPVISKICYKLVEDKRTYENIRFSYKGKPFETKISLTYPLLFKGLNKNQYKKEFMILNFPYKIMQYVHFDYQDMKNHDYSTTEKPMTTERFLSLQKEKQDKLNQKFSEEVAEKEN